MRLSAVVFTSGAPGYAVRRARQYPRQPRVAENCGTGEKEKRDIRASAGNFLAEPLEPPEQFSGLFLWHPLRSSRNVPLIDAWVL